MEWNANQREEIRNQLHSTTFDLLVIGGGVTGGGVAREGQIYGLKCAIVDKDDFAFGTSSRSTKLAHGGIRYLANLELGLVKESTTERNWMRVHFPNLVRPVPFSYCAYAGGKDTIFTVKLATFLYDHLSDFRQKYKNFKKRQLHLEKAEWDQLEPALLKDGLLGGATYYDNIVDDARLTLEIIKEAVARGAVALNYAKVVDYITTDQGKIVGAKVEDAINGDAFEVRAKIVVNATGIWTDELLRHFPRRIIRPTKGVHLIFPQECIGNKTAVGLRHTEDQRFYFVLPRGIFTVIGTTDTDYDGPLDDVICTKEDADYLLQSTQHYFPNAQLDYKHIVGAYAGARPLVMEEGKKASKVSRKHEIFETPDGLVTVCGGKLTIWRKMAEDLVHFIQKHRSDLFPQLKVQKNKSKQVMWIGLDRGTWDHAVAGTKLSEDISTHLYQQYGKGGLEILQLAEMDTVLLDRILPGLPWIRAEFIYIAQHELTLHLMDLLCRRTEIVWLVHPRNQPKVAQIAGEILQEILGWSDTQLGQEIEVYIAYVRRNDAFFLAG